MFAWLIWGFLVIDFRVIAVPHVSTFDLSLEGAPSADPGPPENDDPSRDVSPGFVGCLYSDVCTFSEQCYDDNLFGRCLTEEEIVEANIMGDGMMNKEFLQALELLLESLWSAKFTWKDIFTQCIVKTALFNYKSGAVLDLTVCEPHLNVEDEETSAAMIPKRSEDPIFVHKYTPKRQRGLEEELLRNIDLMSAPDVNLEDSNVLELAGTLPDEGNVEEAALQEFEEEEPVPTERNFDLEEDSPVLLREPKIDFSKELQSKLNNANEPVPTTEMNKRFIADGIHVQKFHQRVVDKAWMWIQLDPSIKLNSTVAESFLNDLSKAVGAGVTFSEYQIDDKMNEIVFRVPSSSNLNSAEIVRRIDHGLKNVNGIPIVAFGFLSHQTRLTLENFHPKRSQVILTSVICASVLTGVVIVLLLYLCQRYRMKRHKLWSDYSDAEKKAPSREKTIQPVFYGSGADNYKDLCRQRLHSKSVEEPTHAIIDSARQKNSSSTNSSPRNSTTLPWGEEVIQSNMDISTGHAILSYMEEHLNAKDKLEAEWKIMCAYEAEGSQTTVAKQAENIHKNRYIDALAYDHSRVKLATVSKDESDYINASYIVDHDPKMPGYIVTQGPLGNTVVDFWKMVWEQSSVVIVNLCCLIEGGVPMCHKYWPEEGTQVYGNYEVHLVSEHVVSEDYIVRSFYLKNVLTCETRTVTQFHYISWPDLDVPHQARSILDFRRKVNKSFRNKTSPLVIHCNDGCGRSGTYVLLDMILNRLNKGVKEVDVAAALEHIRDQRMDMVKTKDQFEFVLTAIAEEVQAILKVMSP